MSNYTRYLEIYLDDHRALASAGTQLARRLHSNLGDTEWEPQLAWFVRQVEDDLDTLELLREAFGFRGGLVKRVAASLGERLGRLKLNGHIVSESPLSPVIETESMIAGVRAKQCLWAALRAAGDREELAGFDLSYLEKSARDQLDLLVDIHRDQANQAFAPV